MRKIVRTMAALMMLLVLVNASAMAAAKVRITHFTYPSHGTSWAEYLNDRAKVFNAKNPDMEVEVLVGDDYASKFMVMLAGGTPPDVTDFHPAMGATHIINGVFADLRPYLTSSGIKLNQLTGPAVVQVLTAPNGSIWGLPADIFSVVTYYNEDIFDGAGLPYPKDLGPKWNWDQAISTGKKTTRDTNGDGVPDIWGLDRITGRYYIFVHQAGGRLYDKVIAPTKPSWNTPEVAQGLSFPLRAMTEKIAPSLTTSSAAVTQSYFWKGNNAVSLVDGPGIIGAYLKDAPFRWNIAQQVAGPVNAGSEITVDAFQIVDASPHKDQAWRWIQFISLDQESHAKFVEYTGRAPSLVSLQRRYQQLNKFVPNNFMAFFDVAALPSTQMNYIIPQASQVGAVVNPLLSQVWRGELPIETAIAQIQNQVTPILSQK